MQQHRAAWVIGSLLILGSVIPSAAQVTRDRNEGVAADTQHYVAAQSSRVKNRPRVTRPTRAQSPDGSRRSTVGQGKDANDLLPSAPNAQTGGRPNNPNPGPTDRSGNVPSENR